MTQTTIVSAAVLYNGIILSMPPPNRHPNIIKSHQVALEAFPDLQLEFIGSSIQGFLTSKGDFIDRVGGAVIALNAGQVKGGKLTAPPNLFSEDLW